MNKNEAVAVAPSSFRSIKALILDKEPDIVRLLPTHVNCNRFIKSAFLAISREPKLLECTQKSLITAVINAAELGLDFTPAKGHAYLIAFKQTATFMPGYRGMIDLAKRSGTVSKIEAHIVHEKDEFSIEYGLTPKLVHKPQITGAPGNVLGAYAIAWFKDDEPQYEFMTKDQLDGIRRRAKTDLIWSSDYIEMCRKTAVRRLFKYLPSSPDLDKAMAFDNQIAGVAEAPPVDDTPRTESLANLIGTPVDAEYVPDPPPENVNTETGEVVIEETTKEEKTSLSTTKQTGNIYSTFKKDYGLNQQDALLVTVAIVKHKLNSMKELTSKEAVWVIESLKYTDTIKGFITEASGKTPENGEGSLFT